MNGPTLSGLTAVTGRIQVATRIHNEMLDALMRYRRFLGLEDLPAADDTSPVLRSIKGNKGVSDNMVYRLVKDIAQAAADCLEEGCEIGTVESLLEQMKAEKNPSTKMLMTIKRLEFLIKSPEDNASDIEKLVSAAARSFSVVDTFNFPGEPIGYTGKVGTTTTAGKSLE